MGILKRLIKIFLFALLFIAPVYPQELDSLKTLPDSVQTGTINADTVESINFDSISSSFFSTDTIYLSTLYNLNLEYLSDGLVFMPSFFRFTAGRKNSPSYLTGYGLPERFTQITLNGFELENFYNKKKLMNIVPVNAVEKIYNSNTGVNDVNMKTCEFEGGAPISNIVYGIGTQDTSHLDITFARDFSNGYRLFASGSTKTLPYQEQEVLTANNDFRHYREFKIFTSINKEVLGKKYDMEFNFLKYKTHGKTQSDIFKISSLGDYDSYFDEEIMFYELSLNSIQEKKYGLSLYLTENKNMFRNTLYSENIKLKEKRTGLKAYYKLTGKNSNLSMKIGTEKNVDNLFFSDDKNNDFKTGRIFGEFLLEKPLKKHSLSFGITGSRTKLFGLEKSFNLRDVYKSGRNFNAYFNITYKSLKNYLEKLSLASGIFETNNNLKDESAFVISAGTQYFNWKNFKADIQVYNVNWNNPVYYYLKNEKYAVSNSADANYSGISLYLQRYLFKNLDASIFCSGNFYKKKSPVLVPKASLFSIIRLREIEDIIYKYPLHSEIIFTANVNLDARQLINYPYFNRFILLEDSYFNYVVLNLKIILKIKRFTFFYQINNINYRKYSLIMNSPAGTFDKKYGITWTFYN